MQRNNEEGEKSHLPAVVEADDAGAEQSDKTSENRLDATRGRVVKDHSLLGHKRGNGASGMITIIEPSHMLLKNLRVKFLAHLLRDVLTEGTEANKSNDEAKERRNAKSNHPNDNVVEHPHDEDLGRFVIILEHFVVGDR